MFKVLYRCNRTIERHTNSPLADSRRRYLEHLAAGGASPSMMRNAAALMYRAVQLLDLEANRPVKRTEVELQQSTIREYARQLLVGDLGVALATLVTMAVIENLSNTVLGRLQHDSAAFHWMVAQNTVEAIAFLVLALTAGFVEEFVFRGYIQRQCQALCGSTVVASILQLIIFSQGHLYQGWIRLVPVLLIGVVLTIVALWRKSLIPEMIAHGFW